MVQAADVNGDGHPDLISSFFDAYAIMSWVLVFLNDGQGMFVRSQEYLLPAWGAPDVVPSVVQSSAVADLDGDCSPDLVIDLDHQPIVLILWNDGHGHFQ
jgi:hypothetical protein